MWLCMCVCTFAELYSIQHTHYISKWSVRFSTDFSLLFNWIFNSEISIPSFFFDSQKRFSIFKHLIYFRCRSKWCLQQYLSHLKHWTEYESIHENTDDAQKDSRIESLKMNRIWIESNVLPTFCLNVLSLTASFSIFLCLHVLIDFYFQPRSHMTTWLYRRKFPLWSIHSLCPDKC